MKKPKALYFNSFKSWFSKKKFFLAVLAVFMPFLTRFEKNNKSDSTFTLTTLKTDKIKCTPFLDFLPIS